MKNRVATTLLSALAATMGGQAFAGGVSGGNASSDWTIYGWQSVSYEFRDAEDVNIDGSDKTYQQYNDNASNIGFAASIDTGMSMFGETVTAEFRCEQFTFRQRFTGSGICNRNSEMGLKGAFGHIMLGQWLLPANEIIAQWIDPFYDHDMNSHANIIGGIGHGMFYYNGGFGFSGTPTDSSFNRRQEEIVQYWTPNIGGFHARIATSNAKNGGEDSVIVGLNGTEDLDPRIWSMGAAYENTLANGDNIWFAIAYELHDEWSAVDYGCSDSDDDSLRLAGRYIKQWGNGMFTRISLAWERLEYEWDDCLGGTLLSAPTAAALGNDPNNLELEKDSWLISGVQNFGNGFDFRFMYVEADEFDCDTCLDDSDTDGAFWAVGLYYNTPAGTEFRLTYNQMDNEDNANYDYTITGQGLNTPGADASAIGVGVTQWF